MIEGKRMLEGRGGDLNSRGASQPDQAGGEPFDAPFGAQGKQGKNSRLIIGIFSCFFKSITSTSILGIDTRIRTGLA